MRKSQTQQIGDVIRDCLRELQIERKLKEVDVISHWQEIMGRTVSSRTEKIYIKGQILYIHVTSSVLKTELLMMRQQIIDRLNERAGEKLIASIVIR
jgi:predicted nucleic acid-binding Zn ribbon protein